MNSRQPETFAEVVGQLGALRAELRQAVIGQNQAIDEVLVALIAHGHALLIGVPGLAKTRLVTNVARAVGLESRRVQFTPDLMPGDVTGSELLQVDPESGARSFRFVPGPVFTNVLLADEINRTPPKTQAALLEAMEEGQVTVAGEPRLLPNPFMVLATQNPVEQEGTYPLPEAQLDRFLLCIELGYPAAADEREVVRRVADDTLAAANQVLSAEALAVLQEGLPEVPAGDQVVAFATELVRTTRPDEAEASDLVQENVTLGAGPRAAIALVTAARAHAVLEGRGHASTADVKAIASAVLRHRLLLGFQAETQGVTFDLILQDLFEVVEKRMRVGL